MEPPRNDRSPRLAAALSALLPGLGQLYNGDRPQGVATLSAALGVAAGAALGAFGPAALRSWATVALMAFVYPFLWLPAVRDAHRRARGDRSPLLAGEQPWYVIFLLATVGVPALPLLWQSPRFSRRAKLGWTAAVIAIALAGVAAALWLGPVLERRLAELYRLVREAGGGTL